MNKRAHHSALWNNFPSMGKNEENYYPREGKRTGRQKREGESSPSFHYARKWRTWVNHRMGMHFWVLTCPISQNHVSQKLMAYPILIWTSILFPSPCNNYLNQFLAKINDWVNKTRKTVDSLMGLPLDIWISPHWLKGLNIPPFILRKSCPHLFNVALT